MQPLACVGFAPAGAAARSRRAWARPPPTSVPRPTRRQSRRGMPVQFVEIGIPRLRWPSVLEHELRRIEQGPKGVLARLPAVAPLPEEPFRDPPLLTVGRATVGQQV